MDLSTEFIIKEEHDLSYDENVLEFNHEYDVKVESKEIEIVDELQYNDGVPTSCQELKNTFEQLCLICYTVFPSSYSLIKHNLSHLRVDIEHLTIEKYKCNRCNVLYINEDEENKHTCKDLQDLLKQYYEVGTNDLVDTVPDKQTPFSKSPRPCNICGKMLMYKSWHGHMQNVHIEQSYTCDLCNKNFSARKYLRNHILYVHEKKRFVKNVTKECEKCKLCPSVFPNRESMKRHVKYYHSVIIKCKICKSKMKKANLVTHMSRMHSNDGVTHRCHRCEKVFKSSFYLNRHMKESRCRS